MRFSGWDRVATFGCGHELIPQNWDFQPPSPAPYGTLCNFDPAIESWAYCVNQTISEHVADHISIFKESIYWVNLVCRKAGGGAPVISFETFYDALIHSSAKIRPIPSVPTKINFPILLNDESRRKLINGVHSEFSNVDNANDSVLLIYEYFVMLALILLLVQFPRIRRIFMMSPFVNKLRSKFQLPTMWKARNHSQHSIWLLGGLVPTSLQALILFWFNVVHLVAMLYNYSVDPAEVMEPVFLQYLQALGNRSGIIAFGMLPLIISFSTRCQILQNLVGLKYTTMLVLHRWIGRLIVVDSVVHSVAFYWHARLSGELRMQVLSFWWLTGVYATVLSCVILIWGTGAIRRRWYEIFLYSHIILAVAFFYLCWQHVKLFGWTSWVWASYIIWGIERINRLFLMAKSGIIEADVCVLDELLIVHFAKPKKWRSFPTQYAFIYFLLPRVFWQSHPFTLVDLGDSLKVVISVKEGATKVLQKAVANRVNDGVCAKIKILLEGPYGHCSKLESFDYVLLISGGSGIPGPLAVAESLGDTGNNKLIIIVRRGDIIEAYREQIEKLRLSTEIYCTSERLSTEITNPLQVVHRGRPDIPRIVTDAIEKYTSVAVICCGPPRLNDQVRNLIAASLEKNPNKVVEYLEEYQVW